MSRHQQIRFVFGAFKHVISRPVSAKHQIAVYSPNSSLMMQKAMDQDKKAMKKKKKFNGRRRYVRLSDHLFCGLFFCFSPNKFMYNVLVAHCA